MKNPHQNTIDIDLKQAIDIGFPEGYPEHLHNWETPLHSETLNWENHQI